jgi:hypothetical protein
MLTQFCLNLIVYNLNCCKCEMIRLLIASFRCCFFFLNYLSQSNPFVGDGAVGSGAVGTEAILRYVNGSIRMMRLCVRKTDHNHSSTVQFQCLSTVTKTCLIT